MVNFKQLVRPLIPVAVVLLLCLTAAPSAEANNGSSTATSQKTTTTTTTTQQDKKPVKATPQKPSEKSVFDADMLERPLSFFKNSFSPEEDEDSDATFSQSTTVVIAVKALIASLLSTII